MNDARLTPENWTPAPLVGDPLEVLYQDDSLVVVAKPPDMTVHREARARRGERHALQTVSRQIGQYLYPVHRIDRNTSGVLAFALTAEAARATQQNLAEAHKEYLTLVRGETPEEFVSERPLTSESGERRPARSAFTRLATFSRCSLLRVVITTGRKHQIRRHLSHLAHQVIGDSSYGKGGINRFFKAEYGLPRMFLHARRLVIAHPDGGAELEVVNPLAPDLREFLGRLPDVDPSLIETL